MRKLKKIKALNPMLMNDPQDVMNQAKERGDVEYGVAFTISKAFGGDKDGNAILFQEPHHTKQQMQIAAARIAALHFYDQMFIMEACQGLDMAA